MSVPRRTQDALTQLAVVAAGFVVYFGVRALTEGDRAQAFANAHTVVRLERALGIDWGAAVQRAALDHHVLVTLANWTYIWGHWPVIACVAVWLYATRPPAFTELRDAFFVSGAIGLVVFALFPVAPPRLADPALVDTVTRWSHSYRTLQPPSLTNEYASTPSLHFGWNLLVGMALVRHSRRSVVRALGVLSPVAMALAVVATANHYPIDVLAGAIVALAGFVVARRRGRARPARRESEPGRLVRSWPAGRRWFRRAATHDAR